MLNKYVVLCFTHKNNIYTNKENKQLNLLINKIAIVAIVLTIAIVAMVLTIAIVAMVLTIAIVAMVLKIAIVAMVLTKEKQSGG